MKPIAGSYYYVDWTQYSEYESDMDENSRRLNESMLDMERSYGGYFLVVNRNNGAIMYISSSLGEITYETKLEDLGVTLADIEQEIPVVSILDKDYVASYKQMRFMNLPTKVLILIDVQRGKLDVTGFTLVMVILVFLIGTGMILWMYWVQRYTGDHELTRKEYEQYHPRRVYLTTLSAILVGAIGIFFVALFYQSMKNISKEAASNHESIDIISSYVKKSMREKTLYQTDAEEWTTYYSERIAELMTADPALRTQEVLSAINQVIGSEFIMLFDGDGKEIVASNSYTGFTLGSESDESADDFSRLLKGVDTIVHSPADDPVTQKYLQQTGSPVDLGGDMFGALIISFNSKESWEDAVNNDIDNLIKRVTPSGKLCVITMKEPGTVVFTTDENIMPFLSSGVELRKGERSFSDMDIFVIDGTSYYGPFEDYDIYSYYFLTRQDQIEGNWMTTALSSVVGYLVIVLIISLVMLVPYKAKLYKESVQVAEVTRLDSIMDSDRSLFGEDEADFSSKGLRVWWSELVPEQRIRIFTQVFAGLLLIVVIFQLMNPAARNTQSTIGFVLRGNWKRGINLLAAAAVFLLIVGYIIFLFVKGLVIGIFVNIMDPKGETVLRLITNLIQYMAFVGMLFVSLDYLGINTTVMLAGFSALSLAVSLGGKDLVADILAGIFIIFEDEFHVGDFIEINGYRGIVQEVGVRSTKLLGLGDNVKIIGNQNVKDVLNMSKMNSWYTMEFNVSMAQPLEKVEEMLQRELPKIGESIPEIISGPFYKGVWKINPTTYTLTINCECKEINTRIVQRDLNHAMIMLFEKNGLKLG